MVFADSDPLQRGEIVERHLDAAGHQRAEALAEDLIAVERQRAISEPVIGMVAIDDAVAAGGGAGKFQRRLDRLRSGIGEKHLVEMRHIAQQTLGQNAGQCRDVHLDEVGKVAVENLLEGVTDDRMVAAEREHAPATEQVEILPVVAVVKILPCPRRYAWSKPIVLSTRTICSFR